VSLEMELRSPAFKGIHCSDQSKQPLLLQSRTVACHSHFVSEMLRLGRYRCPCEQSFSSWAWVNTCHRARMTQSLEIMMAIQVRV